MSLADLVNNFNAVSTLKSRVDELVAIIHQADLEKGAGFLREIANENPILASFIRVGLGGTPAEAVAMLSRYVSPEIARIDGVEHYVARLQEYLRAEATKERPWLQR
jgi:GTP cyclohydrolase III